MDICKLLYLEKNYVFSLHPPVAKPSLFQVRNICDIKDLLNFHCCTENFWQYLLRKPKCLFVCTSQRKSTVYPSANEHQSTSAKSGMVTYIWRSDMRAACYRVTGVSALTKRNTDWSYIFSFFLFIITLWLTFVYERD